VLAADGTHAGLSTEADKNYIHWSEGMATFATTARTRVTS
jgi:hypothetical protein